jgi:hypothetical protein
MINGKVLEIVDQMPLAEVRLADFYAYGDVVKALEDYGREMYEKGRNDILDNSEAWSANGKVMFMYVPSDKEGG